MEAGLPYEKGRRCSSENLNLIPKGNQLLGKIVNFPPQEVIKTVSAGLSNNKGKNVETTKLAAC